MKYANCGIKVNIITAISTISYETIKEKIDNVEETRCIGVISRTSRKENQFYQVKWYDVDVDQITNVYSLSTYDFITVIYNTSQSQSVVRIAIELYENHN